MRSGKRETLDMHDTVWRLQEVVQRLNVSIHVKVEHPFGIIKQ